MPKALEWVDLGVKPNELRMEDIMETTQTIEWRRCGSREWTGAIGKNDVYVKQNQKSTLAKAQPRDLKAIKEYFKTAASALKQKRKEEQSKPKTVPKKKIKGKEQGSAGAEESEKEEMEDESGKKEAENEDEDREAKTARVSDREEEDREAKTARVEGKGEDVEADTEKDAEERDAEADTKKEKEKEKEAEKEETEMQKEEEGHEEAETKKKVDGEKEEEGDKEEETEKEAESKEESGKDEGSEEKEKSDQEKNSDSDNSSNDDDSDEESSSSVAAPVSIREQRRDANQNRAARLQQMDQEYGRAQEASSGRRGIRTRGNEWGMTNARSGVRKGQKKNAAGSVSLGARGGRTMRLSAEERYDIVSTRQAGAAAALRRRKAARDAEDAESYRYRPRGQAFYRTTRRREEYDEDDEDDEEESSIHPAPGSRRNRLGASRMYAQDREVLYHKQQHGVKKRGGSNPEPYTSSRASQARRGGMNRQEEEYSIGSDSDEVLVCRRRDESPESRSGEAEYVPATRRGTLRANPRASAMMIPMRGNAASGKPTTARFTLNEEKVDRRTKAWRDEHGRGGMRTPICGGESHRASDRLSSRRDNYGHKEEEDEDDVGKASRGSKRTRGFERRDRYGTKATYDSDERSSDEYRDEEEEGDEEDEERPRKRQGMRNLSGRRSDRSAHKGNMKGMRRSSASAFSRAGRRHTSAYWAEQDEQGDNGATGSDDEMLSAWVQGGLQGNRSSDDSEDGHASRRRRQTTRGGAPASGTPTRRTLTKLKTQQRTFNRRKQQLMHERRERGGVGFADGLGEQQTSSEYRARRLGGSGGCGAEEIEFESAELPVGMSIAEQVRESAMKSARLHQDMAKTAVEQEALSRSPSDRFQPNMYNCGAGRGEDTEGEHMGQGAGTAGAAQVMGGGKDAGFLEESSWPHSMGRQHDFRGSGTKTVSGNAAKTVSINSSKTVSVTGTGACDRELEETRGARIESDQQANSVLTSSEPAGVN